MQNESRQKGYKDSRVSKDQRSSTNSRGEKCGGTIFDGPMTARANYIPDRAPRCPR